MPPEFMKGGIDSMLTYGDFIAKATLYISIVSLVLDFIMYFCTLTTIKRSNRLSLAKLAVTLLTKIF